MSKYTPGPWTATVKNQPTSWKPEGLHARIATRGGLLIADFDAGYCEYPEEPEVRANARLISAAPELLEALQDLLDLAVGHDLPCSDPERIAAREAIAKALGTA